MYRVRTVFTGVQGSPWLSTMMLDQLAGSAAQAVTAVGTFWGAVDALMGNTVNWTTQADVELVNAATGQVTGITTTTPATGTGALAGELAPLVSQGLVRWRTGVYVAGREVRGRTFIPGLHINSVDDGSVLAASVTTVNTAAAALIADANSALEIWSRVLGVSHDVASGSMWSEFASLRSRRD